MTGTTPKIPPAPWLTEPNELEWTDDATGYPCRMVRNSMGAWCGYVGIPEGHPWFGKKYNDPVKVSKAVLERPLDVDKVGVFNLFLGDVDMEERTIAIALAVDVHGGLNFAEEDDDRWWFGFDCGHAFDLSPGLRVSIEEARKAFGFPDGLADQLTRAFDNQVYRDLPYVKEQVTSLAAQLKRFHLVN